MKAHTNNYKEEITSENIVYYRSDLSFDDYRVRWIRVAVEQLFIFQTNGKNHRL